LRDGNSGAKRLLRRCPVGRVQLEQYFAADAMQEAVRPTFSGLGRQSEGAVDPAQSAFANLAFNFGKQTLEEWHVQLAFLLSEDRNGFLHLSHADVPAAEPSFCPTAKRISPRQKLREPIFLAELDKGFGHSLNSFSIAANSFKSSPADIHVNLTRNIFRLDCARNRLLD
jgi:hypothetical protein